MTVKEMVNEDPFCEVRLANIEHAGHQTDKHLIEMADGNTGDFREIPGVSTVHSDDYKLVTNSEVKDMAAEVVENTGMDFRPLPSVHSNSKASSVFWNGRRFSQKWYTPDTAQSVPGGSEMMLGMEVTNSYDGSCKVGIAFFAMHMLCANQFYSNNLMGRPYEFPHVNRGGELSDDFTGALNQIQEKASGFGRIGASMQKLSEKHIGDFGDFLDFRNRLHADTRAEIRDKQVLDELSGKGVTRDLELSGITYDRDNPSYWDFANAYTAVSTHNVGGTRGSDQSRRVLDWVVKDAQASN